MPMPFRSPAVAVPFAVGSFFYLLQVGTVTGSGGSQARIQPVFIGIVEGPCNPIVDRELNEVRTTRASRRPSPPTSPMKTPKRKP